MTTIRPAREADLVDVVRMGVRFLQECDAYRGRVRIDVEHLARMAFWLHEHGVVFVAERDLRLVGMVGMTLVPAPLTGELVASEAMWWVDRELRGVPRVAFRLLDEAKAWAIGRDAELLHMIAPAGADDVVAMYRRLGLEELESTWQMRLKPAA